MYVVMGVISDCSAVSVSSHGIMAPMTPCQLCFVGRERVDIESFASI